MIRMSKSGKPAVNAPTSKEGGSKASQKSSPSAKSARRDFLIAASNMSWQLAVVVLVPIIGGFKLDEYLNTVPTLTIIGFVLAMAGMAVVVWRQLQLYSPKITEADIKAAKRLRDVEDED